MSWKKAYAEHLDARDKIEHQLVPYFEEFEAAARRAAVADDGPAASSDREMELVALLRVKVRELENKLKLTSRELEKAQQHQRNIAEEQHLRTHAVEGLNDEIIALELQLALSEQRLAKYES